MRSRKSGTRRSRSTEPPSVMMSLIKRSNSSLALLTLASVSAASCRVRPWPPNASHHATRVSGGGSRARPNPPSPGCGPGPLASDSHPPPAPPPPVAATNGPTCLAQDVKHLIEEAEHVDARGLGQVVEGLAREVADLAVLVGDAAQNGWQQRGQILVRVLWGPPPTEPRTRACEPRHESKRACRSGRPAPVRGPRRRRRGQ